MINLPIKGIGLAKGSRRMGYLHHYRFKGPIDLVTPGTTENMSCSGMLGKSLGVVSGGWKAHNSCFSGVAF